MGQPVRLDGKAVVITGSGRGIGAACAVHAAGLGARVVVAHPATVEPVLHRERWTAEDVRRAFAEVLTEVRSPTRLTCRDFA